VVRVGQAAARLRAATVLAMTLLSATAMAQAVPAAPPVLPPSVNPDRINAEERRRLEQRTAPLPEAPRRLVEPSAPAAPAAADPSAVRFTLTKVLFDSSRYLSAADLDALARPLVGTSISIADLQALVERVNALYAARGLVTARAALPVQDIKDGVVSIRLIEGKIGTLEPQGGSARSRRHVSDRIGIATGDLADPRGLELELRRFNLQNDVQLRARLASGSDFGTTDITLDVTEPRRIGIDFFADTNGFASTGTVQGGAVFRAYRLLTPADRLSAGVVKSRGVLSQSLGYSVPWGSRLRFGVSGSHGTTALTTAAPASLDIRGESTSASVDAAALIVVTRRLAVTAGLSAAFTRSNTDIASQRVIDNAQVAGGGSIALNYAAPGFSFGLNSDVSAARVRERISATERVPLLWRGSFAAARALGRGGNQVRVHGDWQYSPSNDLPGLIQYQIGGARSTRAFGPGVAAGDRGFSVSGELAHDFVRRKITIEPFVFVDHAQASTTAGLVALQSAGAGVSAQLGPVLSVRAHYAHGIGHHGLPADGSRGFGSISLKF